MERYGKVNPVMAEIGWMYKNMDRKQDAGHFFCVLQIAAFMDVTEFKSRPDKVIDDIKSWRKRSGVKGILFPRGWSHQKRNKIARKEFPSTRPREKN